MYKVGGINLWPSNNYNLILLFSPTIFEMLDPSYQEADGYALFAALMERMETYYKIRNVVPNASGEMPRSNNNNSTVTMI